MTRTHGWFRKAFSLIFAGVLLGLVSGYATAQVTGAISTTDNPGVMGSTACNNGNVDNGVVNCNIYNFKQDVWLSGLPSGAALPAGTYFFAVLVPGGQHDPNDCTAKNLSDNPATCPSSNTGAGDDWTNRMFTVDDSGIITSSTGHYVDTLNNKIRIYPYDDTTNPGGEYDLAVCLVPDTISESNPPGVDPRSCKYDNFKVLHRDAGYFTIFACKYDDQNGNGVKDADPADPLLPNWKIFADFGSGNPVDKITDESGCVPTPWIVPTSASKAIVLSEVPQDGWHQTAPFDTGTYTGYQGTVDGFAVVQPPFTAGESVTVYFGNTNFKEGGALQIAKDATPAESFTWNITKDVDKTTVKQVGGTATFNYTTTVTLTGSSWTLSGAITISNSSVIAVGLKVVDTIDNGGSCKIDDMGGSGAYNTVGQVMTVTGLNLASGGTQTLKYSCTFTPAPTAPSGTNKVQLYLSDDTLIDDSSADYTFPTPPTLTITDTFNGGPAVTLDTIAYPYPSSKSYNYSQTIAIPANGCLSYTNVAAIKETGQSDSETVTVCGPVKTGALTMGFWQNKNGQAIITGGLSTAGVCNSGTWLRGYAPFQDLSATATCAQVATYVYNAIKATGTTCGGTTCNAMLKGQMLATALDVYFSDPALGGNKISAPTPIGGVAIDLTKICTNIPTCSSFEDDSGVFGAASLTVSQILASAASNSNVGGSIWYGQAKPTQVRAKDVFDAINNQVAFAP